MTSFLYHILDKNGVEPRIESSTGGPGISEQTKVRVSGLSDQRGLSDQTGLEESLESLFNNDSEEPLEWQESQKRPDTGYKQRKQMQS